MAERAIEYQLLQQQADTGFLIKAPSLQRLYIDAALALTDIQTKLDRISDAQKQSVSVSGVTREKLMVSWLNAVLLLPKFLPRRVVFDAFDGKQIRATLWGETYTPLRHGTPSLYKEVTERQLEIGDKELPEPHFFARIFLVNT